LEKSPAEKCRLDCSANGAKWADDVHFEDGQYIFTLECFCLEI
jgi:hypothetical protein